MITLRPADERGTSRLPWLDSRHSFSFAEYRDSRHVHFGPLRVINDDRIAEGGGFSPHSHQNMEIVTYMVEGTLAHADSIGNRKEITAGEVQRMSAGTGITHSEFNASETDPCRLLQIWIFPDASGHEPGWEQKPFPRAEKVNALRPVVSGAPVDGALGIHRDVTIYASVLEAGGSVTMEAKPGRKYWVQMVAGEAVLNGQPLAEGDGAGIEEETGELAFASESGAEFLLFDLD